MARGPSGRLVVDLDPALKRELHSALAADGTTFKEWLIGRVSEYFDQRQQLRLPGIAYNTVGSPDFALVAEQGATFKTSPKPHTT